MNNVQIWRDSLPDFSSEWDYLTAEHLSAYKYAYMVSTLTHASMALKSGNCNEHVEAMYNDQCAQILSALYDL